MLELCSLGSKSNACHFYLQQELALLKQGSESLPAAGLLFRGSPCFINSLLIVI